MFIMILMVLLAALVALWLTCVLIRASARLNGLVTHLEQEALAAERAGNTERAQELEYIIRLLSFELEGNDA